MVLHKIEENKSWVQMSWRCTFPMQWLNILFASKAILKTFDGPEVMAGNRGSGASQINPADISDEKEMLRIRGYSAIFKGNISIVFQTNTNDMTITIPKSLGLPSDYQSLAIAFGEFMDTIELYMYSAR